VHLHLPDLPRPRIRPPRLTLTLCVTLTLILLPALPPSTPASAHALFTDFVQHQLKLTVGPDHVDLVLDLTFFERPSETERRRMDTNGDDQLQRSELETYIRSLSSQWQDRIRLSVGDRALSLIPLHAPEVDLLGDPRVGWTHHRLRLTFFCPAPPDLGPKTMVQVEDNTWPEWPALLAIDGLGQPGYRVKSLPLDNPLKPALEPDETRSVSFLVQRTPATGPEPTTAACESPKP